MTCIVVKRGEYAHYDRLYRAFGDRLPIVWDRRRTARLGEQRQPTDRRNTVPASWQALGFVVAHDSAL